MHGDSVILERGDGILVPSGAVQLAQSQWLVWMRHMSKIEVDTNLVQQDNDVQPLVEVSSLCKQEHRPAIPDLGRLLKAVRRNEFIPKAVLHEEQHWKRVTLHPLPFF
jgi:hypothetical protein